MLRTHNCGELNLINIKQEVVLTGWVQKTRDLGGMTFIDLRDRYGITQLAFNMDINPELCTNARKLGREFVIQINGIVIERTSKNSALKTGDIEIDVKFCKLLIIDKKIINKKSKKISLFFFTKLINLLRLNIIWNFQLLI